MSLCRAISIFLCYTLVCQTEKRLQGVPKKYILNYRVSQKKSISVAHPEAASVTLNKDCERRININIIKFAFLLIKKNCQLSQSNQENPF